MSNYTLSPVGPNSRQIVRILSDYPEALLHMFFVVYYNDTSREVQNRTPGMVTNDKGFRLTDIRLSRIGHAILNEQQFTPTNRSAWKVFDEGKLTPETIELLKKAVDRYHRQITAYAEKTGWSYRLP